MRFLHEDREFEELLRAVAQQHPQRIGVALIEKDYWVTHALWALQQQGFVTALRQYLRVLAGQADLEGVDLDGAATPLVQ